MNKFYALLPATMLLASAQAFGAAVDYPGGIPRQGAVKNADGSVTFCLAAPQKTSVTLVPSWDDYQVLDKNAMDWQDYEGNSYFWTTVTGLADDQWYSYYYYVDEQYKVADPYAHLVLDCYNDRTLRRSVWPDGPKHPGTDAVKDVMLAVYRGDIDDYTFSDFSIPDRDNLVVYEMLFRDFTGFDGKAMGWGTVNKAIEKIPYIKELGFNAVELMPIMEFNGNDSWGYNTNFYMAPDKAYGSPTDYKDFIEECHRNGIAVILDIVFNQSDGLHPWYQMYPIASNPFYNRTAPHAWSVLNDWKQDNPLVQQQWDDALRYWMEKYNVDGFRFDLVKGLGDNNSYGSGTDGYNQSRVDRMKRLHGVIKSVKPDGIHINELLGSVQEEKELGNDGQLQWANVNEASCQYAMGWDDGDLNFFRFNAASDGGRPQFSTVAYAESHDEQRMNYKVTQWGKDNVKTDPAIAADRLSALAVQMLLTPGPKMVWQFGELGNDQNTKDNNGGNDTGSKIVDWAGWLADDNRMFIHDTYAALINLRMDNPGLFARDASFKATQRSGKFSNARTMVLSKGNDEIVAFINPSVTADLDVTAAVSKLTASGSKLICASAGFEPSLTVSGGNATVRVPANGFAVFATSGVAGVDGIISGDSAVKVYGADGRIVIAGPYYRAEVYDLYGRQMPSLEVPAGMYIVRVDGTSSKVVVR